MYIIYSNTRGTVHWRAIMSTAEDQLCTNYTNKTNNISKNFKIAYKLDTRKTKSMIRFYGSSSNLFSNPQINCKVQILVHLQFIRSDWIAIELNRVESLIWLTEVTGTGISLKCCFYLAEIIDFKHQTSPRYGAAITSKTCLYCSSGGAGRGIVTRKEHCF